MTSQTVDHSVQEKARPRDWIQMGLAYLIMPIVLFLCAMDLNWWQGWFFSILLIVVGIGSRVLAEKKHPGLMAERGKLGKNQNVQPWDKVLAPLMAISITFPLFIVAGLDHRFGWSPAIPVWLNIVGLIVVAMGYSYATWAIIENQFFSGLVRIQMERGHKVCDSGPYRFVRHPGYAGNMLAVPGIILALGSVWTIIPGILALIIAIIRTRLEDQVLQKELPGYNSYANRVRYRLIPGIF